MLLLAGQSCPLAFRRMHNVRWPLQVGAVCMTIMTVSYLQAAGVLSDLSDLSWQAQVTGCVGKQRPGWSERKHLPVRHEQAPVRKAVGISAAVMSPPSKTLGRGFLSDVVSEPHRVHGPHWTWLFQSTQTWLLPRGQKGPFAEPVLASRHSPCVARLSQGHKCGGL